MDATEVLPWTLLLSQLFAQGQQIIDLMQKEGGATKQDLIDLAAAHDNLRTAVQAQIDAMPD